MNAYETYPHLFHTEPRPDPNPDEGPWPPYGPYDAFATLALALYDDPALDDEVLAQYLYDPDEMWGTTAEAEASTFIAEHIEAIREYARNQLHADVAAAIEAHAKYF